MRDPEGRAKRRIDRAIEKFAADVGYAEMELLLQKRAQDMREQATATGDRETIDIEDLEGWSA